MILAPRRVVAPADGVSEIERQLPAGQIELEFPLLRHYPYFSHACRVERWVRSAGAAKSHWSRLA
jgi:hypothetical protein